MNDMTTVQPRRVRPVHPSTTTRPTVTPAPLLLLHEWRADVPARVGIDMQALAREGRARALAAKAARRQAAFQPIEVVLVNADFRARIEAIASRRGIPQVCARPVTAPMPLAAG